MPIDEMRGFASRFTDERECRRLRAALTDAVCEVLGEEAWAETWVVLEGVEPTPWGFLGEIREPDLGSTAPGS